MCFKRLFGRRNVAIPHRLMQSRATQASNQSMEALSVPMDNRPLAIQIREFIHRVEQPRPAEIRYSYKDDDPNNTVKYNIREEESSVDEQFSLPGSWHQDYQTWAAVGRQKQSFRELVLKHLEERGINPVDFYTAADIDRKLFSRMKNEPHYHPSKDTAIRCCLALKLDIAQAEHALSLAGYSLSWSLHEDLAIRWCIQHRIFKVYDVMEVVEDLKAPNFGRQGSR